MKSIYQEYFTLQVRMLHRRMRDFGILPLWAWILGICLFVLGVEYLFYSHEQAPYVVALVGLLSLGGLSEKKRSDFLFTHFSSRGYRIVRLLEHFIVVFPFVLALMIKMAWIHAIALLLASTIVSFLSIRSFSFGAFPTPFSQRPFEFMIGWRRSFPLFLANGIILGISLWVGNFNLGVFCLLVQTLVSMLFYSEIEHVHYIWIFKASPSGFLNLKWRWASIHFCILTLPIVLLLLVGYPENWMIVLGIFLYGALLLSTMVFAKYANYPDPINLGVGILIAIGASIPPFLIFLIPFFYRRSKDHLKSVLT